MTVEMALARPHGERVGYVGKPGLVGLLSKNFFLTLVTIGVYRFWAATRLRRYLWSNIEIGGDTLEYTGTGRELFLGFLVGLAVLLPVSIAYVISYRLALGDPVLAGTLQGIYFLALFIFLQIALFRSRRYRLSRTAWRGIYAGQTGTTWRYLGLYLGYGLLTVVTLGLALPWANVALERYKLGNTWFGDRAMSVDAAAQDLFLRWLVVIVLVWAPILLAVLLNLNALLHPVYVHIPPAAPRLPATTRLQLPHPAAFAFLVVSVIGGGLALVWFRIETFRYLASRVSLGEMRLRSGAKGSSAVGRVLLFCLGALGLLIGVAILFAILSAAIAPLFRGTGGGSINPRSAVLTGLVAVVPTYVLLFYALRLISYCWLWIPIIRHLASTLEIENFAGVEAIAQTTRPRQKLGIADSFELGAF